jgi:hypothetical protein
MANTKRTVLGNPMFMRIKMKHYMVIEKNTSPVISMPPGIIKVEHFLIFHFYKSKIYPNIFSSPMWF